MKRWIVAQIGARQHYAIPRMFAARGELRTFYTDLWAGARAHGTRRLPAALRRLGTRSHPDLAQANVTAFNLRTLADELRLRMRRNPADVEQQYARYMWIARRFTSRVNRHLLSHGIDAGRDAYFGFTNGCLETLDLLGERGALTIADQIDPGIVEEQLVLEEQQRWPGWEPTPGRVPDVYWQRLDAERAAAGYVLVNSQWSRRAYLQQGVPDAKIIVVPHAYEPGASTLPPRRDSRGPLRVLYLGSVILRKGVPYLIEAARQIEAQRIAIDIVGRIDINTDAIEAMPANVTFHGPVTRDRLPQVYAAADVFVLPTISDGFAITQLEAMAQGLPVIATPNCGDVVTDGVDGLIVPIRDANALAQAIIRLNDDRQSLADMSQAALVKARQFTLDHYHQCLMGQLADKGAVLSDQTAPEPMHHE